MYIEKINSPADLKNLNAEQRKVLAAEIRQALVKKLSIYGGHCGPNLGMVEATIAMHTVFDSPKDKIVFDVSHQSYTHKMLTGRKDAFLYEEKYGDVSGYTNPDESEHDFFNIGHTSTGISLASGLAKARDLKGEKGNIIAVVGDGSLGGGEALEGLNFAWEMKSNFIVVVNDNGMSIAENHGGLYENLKLLRETDGKAQCNLFKALGLDYILVRDGNDAEKLIEAFEKVKDSTHPVVVHICTEKGMGYSFAQNNKEKWHWNGPFDIESGEIKAAVQSQAYPDITAEYLLDKMKKDKTVAVITSGTPMVLGFNKERRKLAGSQFIDVGIAEEHAVAMASGMAKNGGKPVYGVQSSFMQRTFDQLSQDLCINNNSAVMVVNTASVYAMNDVTHLGIFDIPLISNIPNLVYLAPTSKQEYLAMLDWAIEQNSHPVAVRIPCNGVIESDRAVKSDYSDLNKYEVTKKGSKAAVIALGDFYQLGEETVKQLEAAGIDATLINPMYITGIDEKLLGELKAEHDIVVTLEDGILDGGFGEKIARFYGPDKMRVLNYGLKKEFIDRYDYREVLRENRLTPEQIKEDVLQLG